MVAKIDRVSAGIITSTNIILNKIWNKDWFITNDKLVDNISVILNAKDDLPAIIIAFEIKLNQLFYLIRTVYMMVEYLKQIAIFSQFI